MDINYNNPDIYWEMAARRSKKNSQTFSDDFDIDIQKLLRSNTSAQSNYEEKTSNLLEWKLDRRFKGEERVGLTLDLYGTKRCYHWLLITMVTICLS